MTSWRKFLQFSLSVVVSLPAVLAASAQPRVVIAHNDNKTANAAFKFANVPSPARNDAATRARVSIVDGEADPNGADVTALTDGMLPTSGDQPRRNFFVTAGSGGARVLIDLQRVLEIAEINSYSWHPGSRAPQVYRLWASERTDPRFNSGPRANVDPRSCGWNLVTTVDTRTADADLDVGQFGVSISDARGALGKYRFLLFDFYVTEVADNFGNTFYS